MDKQRLVSQLQQLHTELSEAEQVDPETLQLLRAVTDDIGRLLEKPSDVSPDEVDPVTRGLKDLLLKFESDYPQLSARVGEVADALAAMGL
jgi:Domain of unknown function (DUF4404)